MWVESCSRTRASAGAPRRADRRELRELSREQANHRKLSTLSSARGATRTGPIVSEQRNMTGLDVGAIAGGRRRRTTVSIAITGQALISASERGDVHEAQALLDAGAFVRWADAGGSTALHVAAENGHTEMVALLLSRGASMEAAESVTAATPLCAAVKSGSDAVVAMLLTSRASHDAVSDELVAFARQRMRDDGTLAAHYLRTLELLQQAEAQPADDLTPTSDEVGIRARAEEETATTATIA